jgi:solute carrier family 25 aspartate/glutamate transporter 12/13
MTPEDFVIKFLGLFDQQNYNAHSVQLLAGIVDTSKDGLISFAEFKAFEGLLCFPDALYKTAFQLFDTNGNGMVSFRKYLACFGCTGQIIKCPNWPQTTIFGGFFRGIR